MLLERTPNVSLQRFPTVSNDGQAMNRIKLSPLATDERSGSCQNSVTQTGLISAFDSENGIQKTEKRRPISRPATDEISLFCPLHYEKNYAYPLVVWLHSDGQSADEIQNVMLQMSMRNYVGIAPQSPLGNAETGYFWDQDWDTIDSANDSVLAAINLTQMRFNINRRKIFLAGSGSGGTMAFRLALARPEIFSGVISIGGPLPTEQAPLRDWARCRTLPVFWAHSRRATDFDQDQLCRQLRLLHIAGFSVTLRQYPQTELLCQKTMLDANQWIMETISSAIL